MADAQTDLAVRLRDLLAGEVTVGEKSMFGTRAFLVRDKIVACARRDGGLLVRVQGSRHDELVSRPGARKAEMGAGRTMGAGWIDVSGEAVADDDVLAEWVHLALECNRDPGAGQRRGPGSLT